MEYYEKFILVFKLYSSFCNAPPSYYFSGKFHQ